jgi:hypothetical protein
MIQLKRWLGQLNIGFADTVLLSELLNHMSTNVGINSEGTM